MGSRRISPRLRILVEHAAQRDLCGRRERCGLTQLTDLGGWNASPCWSPDGSRIAFLSKEGGVTTMNADGTDMKQLGGTPELHSSLAWNPVGGTGATHA